MNKLRFYLTSPLVILVVIVALMFAMNLLVLGEQWQWGHNVFLLGICSFVIVYILASFMLCGGVFNIYSMEVGDADAPRLLVFSYWCLSFLGLVLSCYRIYRFGINGPLEGGVLFNLRYVYIWGHESNYGAQHFSLFALCLALYYAQKKRILLCIVASAIYLISALSLAERTSVLFLFVSVVYTLFYIGWVKLKGLLVFFALLVLIFCIIAVATGRAGGEKGFDFLYSYFGYAVTALSTWMDGQAGKGCADLILGKVVDILSLGLYSCVPFDVGFADDDFNVLTYASSPYLAGGVGAVIISMAVLGGWYACLRRLACLHGGYFLAMLSCYVYALVMVFYAWQFSLTTYVYVGLILLPLFYRQRSRPTEPELNQGL